jgi:hypothetical protein
VRQNMSHSGSLRNARTIVGCYGANPTRYIHRRTLASSCTVKPLAIGIDCQTFRAALSGGSPLAGPLKSAERRSTARNAESSSPTNLLKTQRKLFPANAVRNSSLAYIDM